MEVVMRLLAVNGSFRGARGACGRILEAIHRGFLRGGGSAEIVNLAEKRVESCRGCNHCQAAKSYRCVFEGKDDVAEIFEGIRGADVVLYATPVYLFGISSLLKRLIERFHSAAPVDDLKITDSGILFHATDRALMCKPLVSIVVSDNVEDVTVENAKGYFKNYCMFMDARHIAHIERRSASVWLASLGQPQAEIGRRARRILEAYEEMGKELAKGMQVSKRTKHQAETALIRIPPVVKLAWRIPSMRPKIKEKMNKIARTYFVP